MEQEIQQRLNSLEATTRALDTRCDTLLLRNVDLARVNDELKTRVDVMEHFIKQQFPGQFAGEVGTVTDSDLNPISIIYGEPQESKFDDNQTSRIRDADGKYE